MQRPGCLRFASHWLKAWDKGFYKDSIRYLVQKEIQNRSSRLTRSHHKHALPNLEGQGCYGSLLPARDGLPIDVKHASGRSEIRLALRNFENPLQKHTLRNSVLTYGNHGRSIFSHQAAKRLHETRLFTDLLEQKRKL